MKIKKTLIILLTVNLLFSLLPFSFSNQLDFENLTKAASNTIIIKDDTIWDIGSAPNVIDDTEFIFESDLTIDPGVKIFLKNNSRIIVKGIFSAVGTEEAPIIFEGESDVETGNNYSINLSGEENDINVISNVIFKKGGSNQCYAYEQNSLFQKALAGDCVPEAALNINLRGGSFAVTNSQFLENFHGINIFKSGESSYIRESIFANNKDLAIYSENQYGVDASQNCWMRPSGPNYSQNPAGKGEMLIGDFNVYPWRNCGTEHRPIIILPGIGGSWNWRRMFSDEEIDSGNWNFSPGNHFYDSLVESFEDNGYKEGEDLQIVHYDWRQDNNKSVEEFLLPAIEELKEISFDKKYDIISHSMGGLVGLDYIYSDKYQGNINKFVLLGTPVFGSSKVYPVWEGGVLPKDWEFLNIYLWALSKKDKNEGKDYYDLIHEYASSAKQLMPVYDYVVKNEDGETVGFWQMQEQNEYLFDLFNRISQYNDNFDGNNIFLVEGTNIGTSKEVFVDNYEGENSDKLWQDGSPNPYPLKRENLAGDGTVLNESSELFFIDNITKKSIDNATHTELPTKSIPDVYSFLDIEKPNKEYALFTKNQLIFVLACPLDVKIIAPDGKFITKDENQIGEAYYYSDGRGDGYKIVEIQNPLESEYKMELTGNGEGEYDGFIYKTDGEIYNNSEIGGDIKENEIVSYSVLEKEGGLVVKEEEEKDVNSPIVEIISPKEKAYLSNEKIKIDYTAEDDITSEENFKTEAFLDDELFDDSEIDLAFEKTGMHSFKVESEDEAGNVTEKKVEFSVIASYNSLLDNLRTYEDSRLIKTKSYRFLKLQLEDLERLDNFKNLIFSWNHNRRVKDIFERIIDRRLQNLIWLSNKRIKNSLARGLITDRMEFIKKDR